MTVEEIKHLNYIKYSSCRQKVKNPHSLAVCYLLFFGRLIFSIFNSGYRISPICKKILFLAPSINNKKSIQSIYEVLSDDQYELWGRLNKNLPMLRIYFKSLFYLPLFQKVYNTSSKEDKALIRHFYADFMSTRAFFDVIDDIMGKSNALQLIVMSNDHCLESRCIIETAARYNKKTLYVQHASISDKFPPLHFTYSFLDGLDSYQKYKKIGDIEGNVFLSGSPRFDEIATIAKNNDLYDVGIALNALDNLNKVKELCLYISIHFSKKIIVRPHPSIWKSFDSYFFKEEGIAISNSTNESSFAFLSKIKVMIANESSIHLDAALMGIPSILFNFNSSVIIDWYSFIKNGLITVANSNEEIVEKLSIGIQLPENIIRLYNAAFHTPYEGKVGKLIAQFIKKELDIPSQGVASLSGIMHKHDSCFVYDET